MLTWSQELCLLHTTTCCRRDVYRHLASGYQWIPQQHGSRLVNNHVMYIKQHSPLSQRLLDIALSIPIDHPTYEKTVINETCVPVGYYSLDKAYGHTDIYNGCLIR
jgi:hypothetical protein